MEKTYFRSVSQMYATFNSNGSLMSFAQVDLQDLVFQVSSIPTDSYILSASSSAGSLVFDGKDLIEIPIFRWVFQGLSFTA